MRNSLKKSNSVHQVQVFELLEDQSLKLLPMRRTTAFLGARWCKGRKKKKKSIQVSKKPHLKVILAATKSSYHSLLLFPQLQ